jgi:hypothetical protein
MISKSTTYKRLTTEDLKEGLKALHNTPKPKEFVLHTGIGGMKMFNEAIKAEARREFLNAYLKRLDRLSNYDKVEYIQYDNVKEMLYSNDYESAELAMMLIETKEKENGLNI